MKTNLFVHFGQLRRNVFGIGRDVIRRIGTVLIMGHCLTAPALASETAEDALIALEGDIEYGAYLSSECTSCHQLSGANDGIPGIVGWEEDTYRLSMLDYRTKLREHPVMNMIAGRLSDDEIAALSAYFATLEETAED